MQTTPPRPSRRGFAAMSPEKQRAIASMGGKAAHASGKAHKWTSETASDAARITHKNGTAHYFSTEEARAAGRKGGRAKAANRRAAQAAPKPLNCAGCGKPVESKPDAPLDHHKIAAILGATRVYHAECAPRRVPRSFGGFGL